MLNSLEQTIKRTIAQTKIHKDAFLIPALMDILQELVNNNSDETTSQEEIILLFAEKTTEALVSSPIFSGTLLRALYRSMLDLATERKLSRESILEELLFQ
ncbi:MAG: hypothetical protein QG577_2685, partial [Thermodesulfobacteriota bacterium]|nr:hypothetical protein [Thermodesulfobacteriota bacterium]